MSRNSLETFVDEVRKIWGPLDSEVVQNAKHLFGELIHAPATESWIAELIENPPEAK